MRVKLENIFQIKFVPHDSYHIGEYYRSSGGDICSESWRLRQNIMFEDELHYPEFPEDSIILDIGSTERGEELRAKLENLGFKLFKRTNHE
ncbi:MAG TPA: hypothetical protein VG754_09295 [Verrucomicrobiae bacterium]|jgi:hypothetical protein|nr:hypothetical protein [Verrucomicrobiae bacterium]